MTDNNNEIPADIDIYPVGENKYAHTLPVHRAFFGFIIGRNGSMLNSIQRDTGTTISIPRQGDEVQPIVINGSSRPAVFSARKRIESIVQESKKKLKFTHFLAIPMTEKGIAENFAKFKSAVLNETGKGAKGVREEIFQKPEKMHLTLGMLVLLDDKDIQAAAETLEECRKTIITPIIEKHGPIKIKAQGLGTFDKDLAKIRVLYGLVSTENDVLQGMTDKIADCFVEKGLMRKERDEISLHLTLMNASFGIDKKRSGWRPSQPIEKIDASNIMKEHKDYVFGESIVNTVQICHLGQRAADGYYTITSKINLSD